MKSRFKIDRSNSNVVYDIVIYCPFNNYYACLAAFLARDFSPDPLFIIFGGAFRPKLVKVGALSAPTLDMLLKYCLDLSYIQLEVVNYNSFIIHNDSGIEM